jgi:hypothetical protein
MSIQLHRIRFHTGGFISSHWPILPEGRSVRTCITKVYLSWQSWPSRVIGPKRTWRSTLNLQLRIIRRLSRVTGSRIIFLGVQRWCNSINKKRLSYPFNVYKMNK